MAPRTEPPFRADHVGSLLRPPRCSRPGTTPPPGGSRAEELRAVEDRAITDVVRMQSDVGLQSATDGEFRRASWHMDFIYRLGGVHPGDDKLQVAFRDDQGELYFEAPALVVDQRSPAGADLRRRLRVPAGTVTTATPKLTIPSPSMVHYRGGRAAHRPGRLPGHRRCSGPTSSRLRRPGARRRRAGLQVPAARRHQPRLPQRPAPAGDADRAGDDAEHQHLRYIRQINAALPDRPRGCGHHPHVPRQLPSSWAAEGGYDFVAEALFGELAVDGFFLEYDDARSGASSPLRFVPPARWSCLGLVTTKRPALESKDTLKRRIDEARSLRDLDQLCLSPAVRLLVHGGGQQLTYDEEVAKLRLIVEVAQEVWG
jgi:5-methyltetrahydropteroyltriglutamate--homocysteine methyltransferase